MGSKRTYTKKELTGYLVGMFGQNMIYNIIATGLVSTYLQFNLFIPVQAIGIIIFIARIWDAINDPMMGTIVDRTRTKWGKCRPYLIIFPAIIGVSTILCFVNGIYTNAHSSAQKALIIGWAAVSYIVWGMLFTVCDIPLWGITSLMTEDENDRSKVLGLARIVAGIGGIGILIAPIGQAFGGMFTKNIDPSDVQAINSGNQKGFILAVVILTVVSSVLFEFAGLSTRERVSVAEEKHTIKENFQIMWKCKPFRQILISGILRSPIQLLMLIAMPFVTYYFANGDIGASLMQDGKLNFTFIISIAVIAGGIFAGQFIAMAITPALTKKYENKKIYNFYCVACGVPFALLYVIFKIAHGDLTPLGWAVAVGLLLALGSAGMGGINVMQSIMIADCVDYEEYHNGIRPDGVFFSGQSFITKLSGGIAALIQSAVYGYVNFSDEAVNEMQIALKNGESFITYNDGKFAASMFFLISVPIAIGMLLSAIPTAKYAMTDKEHSDILDELVKRRGITADAEDVAPSAEDAAAIALENNMDNIIDEINKLD